MDAVGRLKEDNYIKWKWAVTKAVGETKLSALLNGQLPDEEEEEFKRAIGERLDTRNKRLVQQCTTFKELWERLETFHGFNDPIVIYQKIASHKVSTPARVPVGVNETLGMIEQLRYLGETVSDNFVMAMIFSSLPSYFKGFSRAWRCLSRPENTIDDLVESLTKHSIEIAIEEREARARSRRRGYGC